MEYIYAAMLLHKAGKKVEETSVKKVLEAAGVKADEARIKALVAALEGVNIDEAIEKAQFVPAAASVAAAPHEEKKEAHAAPKKEEKNEEQAAAGLGALFG